MKFLVSIIVSALLAFSLGLWFPWYTIVVATGVVGYAMHQQPWKAFLSGFLAIALLWGGLSYYINEENQHILFDKIGQLFFKSNDKSMQLILTSAIIGGIVGGLAAMSGSFARAKR